MIIKKPKFNTGLLKKSDWPFTVPEVTVVASIVESNGKNLIAFAICHNMTVYALSGILESHGLPSLKMSGIWKPTGEKVENQPVMVNLQPFFTHCENEYKKILKRQQS
ncbi:MAG: hypothetical protein P8X74_03855 [Reinekea sp.]